MTKINSYIKLGLSVVLLTGLSMTAFAQNGGSAGSFSRLGFGPRGMAMGNALVANAENGIYSYYNPALAAQSSFTQIDLSTAAMSFDRSLNTASGTFQLPPTAGVSLSIINANVSDIDGRSSSGYHTEMLSTQEYQIAAALGQEIGDRFSIGVGLKYYISDLHNDLSNAKTLGIDIGILYLFSDRFKAGAVVRDLLASYRWSSGTLYGDNSSSRADDFPTQIQLGVSYILTPTLSINIEGGKIVHQHQSKTNFKIGSTYQLHERITLRGGWQIDDLSSLKQTDHFSTGFSVHLPFDLFSPSIDYAFVQEPSNISYMHTFGIQLKL
ncbi:OmpP1/FadL family transporter [Fodinibius sp. SL11]|uniref:OmpP1/FadL family transporter n=1 Tax=Fodinibius sp. SL11 TaxID=3425690 RepID=UPI003F881862